MERIQGLDVGLWNFFQDKHRPWLDAFFVHVSALANPLLLTLLLAGVAVGLLWRRRTPHAVFLLAMIAGGLATLYLVPPLIGRDRPDPRVKTEVQVPWPAHLQQPQVPLLAWGYPSQFTLLATVTWLSLALVFGDLTGRPRTWRRAAFLLVFLTGLSRMYLGVCYPTDVIGGWLAGSALVLLGRWVHAPAVGAGVGAAPLEKSASAAF